MSPQVEEKSACRRFRRAIALLAGGELGRGRAARLRRHQAVCGGCRRLQAELGRLARLGDLLRLDPGELDVLGFRPGRPPLPVPTRAVVPLQGDGRPIWSGLIPVAAALAIGAFLLAGRLAEVDHRGRAATPERATSLHVSLGEDAHQAILEVGDGGPRVHRVAVSYRPSDFRQVPVYEMDGGRWVDSTPLLAPGQVVFYRVD